MQYYHDNISPSKTRGSYTMPWESGSVWTPSGQLDEQVQASHCSFLLASCAAGIIMGRFYVRNCVVKNTIIIYVTLFLFEEP